MIKVGDKIEIMNAEELGWINLVKNGDIYDVVNVEQLRGEELEVDILINGENWTLCEIDINDKYVKLIPQ